MTNTQPDDGSKLAKNIAAVVYLIVLIFLVGGSYINQKRTEIKTNTAETAQTP